MAKFFFKDPSSTLDYKIDLKALTNGTGISNWLQASEILLTATITAEDGITVASSTLSDSNTSVTIWLSGGTEGRNYTVTARVVTSAGRTEDHSITLVCKQK